VQRRLEAIAAAIKPFARDEASFANQRRAFF
jgi:hypothetical protein